MRPLAGGAKPPSRSALPGRRLQRLRHRRAPRGAPAWCTAVVGGWVLACLNDSIYSLFTPPPAGENVILIANHQSEADPAVFALLLEKTFPHLAEGEGGV